MNSGASDWRLRAKARAGIRCCSCWWPIGCCRRAASGDCIGDWFERSALGDLLGADARWPTFTRCTPVTTGCSSTRQALFDHLVGRWRDLFNVSFDVLLV